MRKLKTLEYPNKTKIEEEITIIKDSRNMVFHNLVRAGEKGLHLDIQMLIVQDHTPVLRKLITYSILALAEV